MQQQHPYLSSSSSSGPSGQLSSHEGGGGGRASGQFREGICTGFPRSLTLPPLDPEKESQRIHQSVQERIRDEICQKEVLG
jgi:hypothetical protein